MILQLRQIVKIICTPAISSGQIAYLSVLISEYLDSCSEVFQTYPMQTLPLPLSGAYSSLWASQSPLDTKT